MTMTSTLDELLTRRLYHELTSALLEQLAVTEKQGERVALFRRYVSASLAKNSLNPLRVVDLVRQLLKRGDDDGAVVLEILDEIFPTSVSSEAEFQTDCLRVECRLRLEAAGETDGDSGSESVRAILAKLEDRIDEITAASGGRQSWKSVSEYSRVNVLYAKRIGNLTSLYFHGVRYMSATPAEQLQSWILRDAATAGLLSAEIFDLGGFLGEEKKLRAVLGEGEAENLLTILRAFDCGDIRKFEQKISGSGVSFTSEQVAVLKHKIQLMRLLEISTVANIDFATIAREVALETSAEVQLLVLRALGGGLMRGAIDEFNNQVRVDWVRPRILDRARIGNLKQQFDVWRATLESNFRKATEL